MREQPKSYDEDKHHRPFDIFLTFTVREYDASLTPTHSFGYFSFAPSEPSNIHTRLGIFFFSGPFCLSSHSTACHVLEILCCLSCSVTQPPISPSFWDPPITRSPIPISTRNMAFAHYFVFCFCCFLVGWRNPCFWGNLWSYIDHDLIPHVAHRSGLGPLSSGFWSLFGLLRESGKVGDWIFMFCIWVLVFLATFEGKSKTASLLFPQRAEFWDILDSYCIQSWAWEICNLKETV